MSAHDEPRSPYRQNHFQEANIAAVHVHVSSRSRDCDGPLEQHHVQLPEASETAEHFFARTTLSACAYNGDVTVTVDEDGQWAMSHSYPTDEGYHSEEWRSCVWEDCRDERPRQRDHYAEAMGY